MKFKYYKKLDRDITYWTVFRSNGKHWEVYARYKNSEGSEILWEIVEYLSDNNYHLYKLEEISEEDVFLAFI